MLNLLIATAAYISNSTFSWTSFDGVSNNPAFDNINATLDCNQHISNNFRVANICLQGSFHDAPVQLEFCPMVRYNPFTESGDFRWK